MVFGLFRSHSERRPAPARRTPRPPRPRSGQVFANTVQEVNYAYKKAVAIYEAEASQLNQIDASQRARNDRECKRQMEGIQKRKKSDEYRLETDLERASAIDIAAYRAGKITPKELEKRRGKLRNKFQDRMASLRKWEQAEQAKAQRIFYARNEEIGEKTGAALRVAKAKMVRNRTMIKY